MDTNSKTHVSLYVSDVQATTNFYNFLFNQSPTKTRTDYAKYDLDDPALVITFIQRPGLAKPGFGHMGIRVNSTEEVKQRLSRVQETGMNTKEEMGTACCYSVQDKFWVSDPDGHQWEVYHFHEGSDFEDPHRVEVAVEEGACCTPGSGGSACC